MTIQNINFKAQWDLTNAHLKAPEQITIQKVKMIAWNTLSLLIPIIGLAHLGKYIVESIINRQILPIIRAKKLEAATQYFNDYWRASPTDENREVREYFVAEKQTVLTPDGSALSALFVRHKDTTAHTPTVIYFNGRGQLASAKRHTWFFEQSVARNVPCNFVFFDYRGLGESTGIFKTANDLIVDGSAITQWVRGDQQLGGLGTPAHLIHFYGYSLGGGVAAQTQALDAEHLVGCHVNERSFSSLANVSKTLVSYGLGSWIAKLIRYTGYNLETAEALRRLQGKTLVIYHPKDRIIPYEASLHKAVTHKEAVCLIPKPQYEIDSAQRHHTAPLDWHEGVIDRIAQFLFALPKTAEAVI